MPKLPSQQSHRREAPFSIPRLLPSRVLLPINRMSASPAKGTCSESRPSSYCSSCRRLFSPQGFRQASAAEGFIHSRTTRTGRMPWKEECTLCAFIDAVPFKSGLTDLDGRPDVDADGDIRFITLGQGGRRTMYKGDQAVAHELVCQFQYEISRGLAGAQSFQSFLPVADFGW